MRVVRLLSILLVVTAGCSGASDDPQLMRQRAELDEAVALWANGDRSDYSYVYLRTCQCVEPEPQGPNTVFVIDGNVDAVEHFGRREALDGFSVEELFDRIEEAIDDGRQIAVTYDEANGVPTSLNLDLSAGPDDDPLTLEIRSFLSYAEHRAALAEGRTRWRAADIDQYQIRYQDPSIGLVEVEVEVEVERRCRSRRHRTRGARADRHGLLRRAGAAIAERPDSFVVDYHPELGYPTSYRIEYQSDRRLVVEYESIEVTS